MRPRTQDELLRSVHAWRLSKARKFNSIPADHNVKDDIWYRFTKPKVVELYTGELRDMEFVDAMIEFLQTQKPSVRSHRTRQLYIPYAFRIGIINSECRDRWLASTPKVTYQRQTWERAPSVSQMRAWLQQLASEHDPSNPKTCQRDLYWLTLLFTGVRAGQCLSLETDNVRLFKGTDGLEYIQFRFVTVKQQRKGFHEATVPLYLPVTSAMTYGDFIYDHLSYADPERKYFFNLTSGEAIASRTSLKAALGKSFHRATGYVVGPHGFRAFALTMVLRTQGVDAAAAFSGHVNRNNIYAYLSNDPGEEAISFKRTMVSGLLPEKTAQP